MARSDSQALIISASATTGPKEATRVKPTMVTAILSRLLPRLGSRVLPHRHLHHGTRVRPFELPLARGGQRLVGRKRKGQSGGRQQQAGTDPIVLMD